MRFNADLHLHIDEAPDHRHWHGIPVPELAKAIARTHVDICALTEHNKVGCDIFNLREELERLSKQKRQKILCLLGVELSMIFDGHLYHVGYIFEEQFTPHNLPESPGRGCTLEDIEILKKTHPGIAILFHPTWRDSQLPDVRPGITETLMTNHLIDGVEILNGSLVVNGAPTSEHHRKGMRMTQQAIEMFLRTRAAGRNVAPIGSSDAHRQEKVGIATTSFEGDIPQDLFRFIREGRSLAVAHEEILHSDVLDLHREMPASADHLQNAA